MNEYGYVKVGASTLELKVSDTIYNVQMIKKQIDEAVNKNIQIISFPELSITGYTCGDLFNQDILIDKSYEGLKDLVDYSKDKMIVIIVGSPIKCENKLYNCAVVINNGKILGIVPKTYIPNYNEFYEMRWFKSSNDLKIKEINLFNEFVPIGVDLIFTSKLDDELKFGVEICEDLWLPDAPSQQLALNGATLILNPSASNELTTKKDYRRQLVSVQSAKLICGYVYTNAGSGESTTDVVFSGHHMIVENGSILNESQGFDESIIYGDIDLGKLCSERRKMNTFKSSYEYDHLYFDLEPVDLQLNKYYDPHPFVPHDLKLREQRCKEVFEIQTRGLMQRLKATHISKVVIGISGGLDSTLALLVCVMAFEKLGYDKKNIYAITMPCFGTTSRTKNNALGLMEELGVTSETVNIAEVVKLQFKNIHQDENVHDVTYENVQARERTEILMNKANQIGGLVIGTGDLSEVALGWSTYNGDHMSMYAVNVSVPKTLVRYLVDYVSSLYKGQPLEKILQDVLDTPVSPELLPQEDDKIVQKTEDIVGPYELHDFFIYHMVRFGDEPKKLYRKTKLAFKDKYDKETIKKWLRLFYWRFFTQQFKRSCIPDGPKVGSVALSPRGDWRMPSDASVQIWLNEIEKI